MATTARDIIKDAAALVGVEEVPNNDYPRCLRFLNNMVDSWPVLRNNISALTQSNKTLTASTGSYAIGSGQTINESKPYGIDSAFVRDSNSIDTPIRIITKEEYDSIVDKTIEGPPRWLYYDKGATEQATQTGTIYLHPVPDSSTTYTLYFESRKPYTGFSLLTTTFIFPRPYEEAMIFNLALRLGAFWGMAVPPWVIKIAQDAENTIKTLNHEPLIAVIEVPSGSMNQGGFNITSGDYN